MSNEGPTLGLWHIGQRRGLIVLGLLILAFVGFERLMHPLYLPEQSQGIVDDETPADDPAAPKAEPLDKIDPNTATAAMLATLPLIGEKKSEAVVAYREEQLKAHPGMPVFKTAQDLTHIRGIGKATVERLSPYLVFGAATRGAE